METPQTTPAIRAIDPRPVSAAKPKPTLLIIVAAVSIIAGIFTGFGIRSLQSKSQNPTQGTKETEVTNNEAVATAGIKDEETFKDKAEGILKEGGIDGEGAYHLERPGGASQNAYLTSTTINLEDFLGKKVRVWGKTFQGEKAGWLMDVGFVEVLP